MSDVTLPSMSSAPRANSSFSRACAAILSSSACAFAALSSALSRAFCQSSTSLDCSDAAYDVWLDGQSTLGGKAVTPLTANGTASTRLPRHLSRGMISSRVALFAAACILRSGRPSTVSLSAPSTSACKCTYFQPACAHLSAFAYASAALSGRQHTTTSKCCSGVGTALNAYASVSSSALTAWFVCPSSSHRNTSAQQRLAGLPALLCGKAPKTPLALSVLCTAPLTVPSASTPCGRRLASDPTPPKACTTTASRDAVNIAWLLSRLLNKAAMGASPRKQHEA